MKILKLEKKLQKLQEQIRFIRKRGQKPYNLQELEKLILDDLAELEAIADIETIEENEAKAFKQE